MFEAIGSVLRSLTAEGGLLRVRAVLAMALTGFGGAYLLTNQTMPPAEYNLLWTAALTYYFATRGAKQ
jgi:hypothetical protein